MEVNEILENNKKIKNTIISLKDETYRKVLDLKKKIIAPCESCPYGGVYRCEACSENFYAGYNIKHYPRQRL